MNKTTNTIPQYHHQSNECTKQHNKHLPPSAAEDLAESTEWQNESKSIFHKNHSSTDIPSRLPWSEILEG